MTPQLLILACQWNWKTGYMPSLWMSALYGLLIVGLVLGSYWLGKRWAR